MTLAGACRLALLLGAAGSAPTALAAASCDAVPAAATLVEDTRDGGAAIEHPLDNDKALLDFRSSLDIAPNPTLLRSLGTAPGDETPQQAGQRQLRQEICRTLVAAQAYPVALAAARRELQALHLRGGFTPEQWQSVARRPGLIADEFDTRFIALAEAAVAVQNLDADAAARKLDEYKGRIFAPDSGDANPTLEDVLSGAATADVGTDISLANLAAVLDEFARLLQPVATGQGPDRWLRMHAYVHPASGGDPVPVRIENYFEVAKFDGAARTTLGLALTDAQRRQFDADMQLTRQALQVVQDWPARREALKAGLREDLEALRADAERAGAELTTLLTETLSLERGLAERLAEVLTAEDRRALDAVRAAGEDLKRDYAALRARLDRLRASVPSADIGTLPVLLADARALRADVDGVVRGAKALGEAFETAGRLLRERGAAAVDAEIARLEAGVKEALAPLQARFGRYADLARGFAGSLDGLLGGERLVENPPLGTESRLVAVDKLEPGRIDLEGKVADRGDTLRLEMQLLEDPPAGSAAPPAVKATLHKEFKVERFGFTGDIAPHLAFVKRRGARDVGEPDVNFQPLPMVAWTGHYRPRPGPTLGWWDRVAAKAHPGFGLSAVALDFENKGAQLGVGVQLSLFDDFLFVGYGHNVQSQDPYFYFGLGLTRWLGAFGGDP